MKTFGHSIKGKERPARRVTRGALSGCYGPDRGKKLVVELRAGDLIVFRPFRSRRYFALSVFDAFRLAVKSGAHYDTDAALRTAHGLESQP